jgi:AmmeMemoRadiSam system protein A
VEQVSKAAKKYLLKLARRAIEAKFETKSEVFGSIPPELEKERGTFVTLTIRGKLRGCIGNVEPEGPIYSAVSRNAVLAAFNDSRFPVLTAEEAEDIKVEVSILAKPRLIDYDSSEELLEKLNKFKPGVVLEKDWRKATFLPQVWDEIEDGEKFMEHLCLKARLSKDTWRDDDKELEIYFYDVIKFSEGEV